MDFLFFKEAHGNQHYPDGRPYWIHLLRVGNKISSIINFFKEGDLENGVLFMQLGYGHDLLEDTSCNREYLEQKLGKELSDGIFGLTNEEGDDHTEKYVEKICLGSEEVRLVKLADLNDNFSSILYNLKEENKEYLIKKIVPIMIPMREKIKNTSFFKYPQSANFLMNNISMTIETIDTSYKYMNQQ